MNCVNYAFVNNTAHRGDVYFSLVCTSSVIYLPL